MNIPHRLRNTLYSSLIMSISAFVKDNLPNSSDIVMCLVDNGFLMGLQITVTASYLSEASFENMAIHIKRPL